jgi:hypothetical protein
MTAPTIPDAERRTPYHPSSPTTVFAVNFVIYDLADVAVVVDGVELDAADYTVTGTLADQCYSDAVVTLDSAVQGVDVAIVGAFAPRRTSNFTEGNKVPARDLNTTFNRIVAGLRELFDKFGHIGPIAELAELVESAQDAAAEAESFSRRNIVAVAGTAHVFDLDDVNAIVDCQGASPTSLTIPPSSSEVWTIGDQIDVRRGGAGVVTFLPGAGVTITSPHGYVTIPTQYGMATLIYMGSNTWQLTGGLG